MASHIPIARADLIEGMAKGMAVLEGFDTERRRLNATLAAQRAGLSRAAARRHLLTLAHLGYLETDGSWFWLSPRVLRFSGSYLSTARLPRALQPLLTRLAREHAAAFSAVVLDEAEVVIVASSGPGQGAGVAGAMRLLAYGIHLGARLPAHATSTGCVLLAGLPAGGFAAWLRGRRLARHTPRTPATQTALRAAVARARADDHCLAIEAHEPGVHALAVPLREHTGATVAALNVVLPGSCPDPASTLRRWLPVLRDAAQEARAFL